MAAEEYTLQIFKLEVRTAATHSPERPKTNHRDLQDESEPTHQLPIAIVTDCQVYKLATRKQDPPLPTLAVTFTDKERKRRSSRAASIISGAKESSTTTWFFRPATDEPQISLHKWARFIQSKIKTAATPESPASPIFSNPFSPRPRETSDYFKASGTLPLEHRTLNHKSSTATYSTATTATGDGTLTFNSATPSLRSKRSDISSPASVQQMPYSIPNQHYTTVLPTDLPSPIASVPEHSVGFGEGWTSAHGRTSALSSPIRGRGSVSSQLAFTPGREPSALVIPRETILDMAFQMKCIPGYEQQIPGEDKLSSLARFDALMRGVEERRQKVVDSKSPAAPLGHSAFEADDSSSNSSESLEDSDETESERDEFQALEPRSRADNPAIDATARRALDFITNRHDQTALTPNAASRARPSISRTPLSFHADDHAPTSQKPPLRPHTSHSRSRPGAGQRASSTSQLLSPTSPPVKAPTTLVAPGEAQLRLTNDQRQSSNGIKRLSFTEFTKKLSSTSSLLLSQSHTTGVNAGNTNTNTNTNTNNTSINEGEAQVAGLRTSVAAQRRLPPRPPRDDHDVRCSWRSVIDSQGGFV